MPLIQEYVHKSSIAFEPKYADFQADNITKSKHAQCKNTYAGLETNASILIT